jgi:hypothetical protein
VNITIIPVTRDEPDVEPDEISVPRFDRILTMVKLRNYGFDLTRLLAYRRAVQTGFYRED